MVATRRNRWLVVQGTVALCGNVLGNLLLVPRFGVTASAWLTVATEVGVCAGSVIGMRRSIDMGPVRHVSLAPLAAGAAMVVVGGATVSWPIPSMAASGAAFLVVLGALRGWPEEVPLPVPLLRRFAVGSR
jgi:O-antigen/teichoic acid export membrane protein